MNLYLVTRKEDAAPGEYESMVVAAPTPSRALETCQEQAGATGGREGFIRGAARVTSIGVGKGPVRVIHSHVI